MRKDLIVAIFTPTSGALQGMIGTGYPISEDLILTSRHVVQPEKRNSRTPIRVRWFYDRPATGQQPDWIPIKKKDDLVWVGPGGLDAALIRCPIPESLRRYPHGRIVERMPEEGARWSSSGFARANKRDNVREPGEFGGTVRSMAEAAAFFEVIEDAQPNEATDWMGASGMPVCVGDEVFGVVKHVPANFKHKKLEVVPSWRLLADAGFCRALGFDEVQERIERARKLLLWVLERSDNTTRDFAAALKLFCGEIARCRSEVVDALLDRTPPLEQLFQYALVIQRQRRNQRDWTGAKVAADLVLTILPAIHDATVVSRVRRSRGEPSVCLLALPTRLRTLAEIIMAGADRRAATLRQTGSPDPDGEACLPEPPESGRDADGQQFTRDWRRHLIDTFGDDSDRFANEFRTFLKERFLPSHWRSPNVDIAERELLDTVAARLRLSAEDTENGLTYYFIAQLPKDEWARHKREDDLAKLRREFPYIAFLQLSGGGEPLPQELTRYCKIWDLLDVTGEPGV